MSTVTVTEAEMAELHRLICQDQGSLEPRFSPAFAKAWFSAYGDWTQPSSVSWRADRIWFEREVKEAPAVTSPEVERPSAQPDDDIPF